MFFQKKAEMQDIKKAVSEESMTPAQKFYPPRESRVAEGQEDDAVQKAVRSQEDYTLPAAENRGTAPLFVKVDKYYGILKDIQEMKMFLSGTKHLYHVLEEVENVRNDTLKVMRATIQRLEKSVTEIDSSLLRPREGEYPTSQDNPEVRHIEGSLNELQSQLDVLKKELQSMK
ncbi:MAG TPA: hypothetical protein VI979_02050 [archaeon]|nr:hypothetical protein [archaeon]